MTAWTVVLAASLAMPVLMDRLTVTIPAAAQLRASVPAAVPALSGSAEAAAPAVAAPAIVPPEAAAGPPPDRVTATAAGRRGPAFDWRTLAAAVYLAVATVMLLRLFTGLMLSFRIARAARPLRESWTGGADVRVTDAVTTPVTFGSTVLLPATYAGWNEAKRQAALSHERSHAIHGDFYVLLLAAFNRAVFWFNPLAWWQLVHMAELAEIISDDAALETVGDRPSYAGILVDLAGSHRQAPAAVAMARARTLCRRVERILAGTTASRIGWRKRALVALALVPAVILSAAAVGPGAASPPAGAADAEPHPFDRYAGWYAFNGIRSLTVGRAGDRLIVQETGREKFEMMPEDELAFVSQDTGASVTFTPGGGGRIAEAVLQEPGARPRRAVRVDAGQAEAIGSAFARRVAAAAGRFQDQAPADGSRDAVLRVIDDLRREAPGYGRMSPQLADIVRRQMTSLHATVTALGAVDQVFFRGVSPGGFDIYGVKFAGGLAEFRILLDADGTIEDMIFRPDGDGSQGEVAACLQERTLKPQPGGAPIKLWLYNESGADIRVSAVDAQGDAQDRGRLREFTIAGDRSAPVFTRAGWPLAVTDAAGQCLEIIVPGQSTRYHIIAADARERAERPAPRRTAPMPGSEQALRRYIDGLGRGEPDYAGMTPQIAAATRQELVLDRAILARLGTLRALSFRGVSLNGGNDIYIAHFANGSAEWRIGLVRGDRIGRIALGPQY
jgi:hypothetical protein